MTGPLNIKVVTDGDTRGLDKTAKALDGVADNAEEAEKAILGLGKESDKTSRKTDQLGDELNRAGREAEQLKRKVLEAEAALKLLARQYIATGDEAVKAEMKQQQAQVAELKRLDNLLNPKTPKPKKGPDDNGPSVMDRLGKGLGPLSNPYVLGGAAVAGLVGAPMVGGAVMAGAGFGLAGAGIAGAVMREPELFKAAWSQSINAVQAEWQAASADFVGPALDGLQEITDAVLDIGLREQLEGAAEFVGPLSTGLAGLVKGAGEGFGEMIKDAKPVIDAMQKTLPNIGDALGGMFEDIGQGSEGASEAIYDLGLIIASALTITGKIIETTSDWYDALVKVREALPGDTWLDTHRDVDLVGRSFDNTAKAAYEYEAAAAAAQAETERLNKEFEDLFDITMNAAESAIRWEENIDRLTESVRENGKTIDITNDKGRQNVTILQDMVSGLKDTRDNAIRAANGSKEATEAANAAYRRGLGLIEDQMRKLGFTEAQIRQVTGAWKDMDGLEVNISVVTAFRNKGTPPSGLFRGNQGAGQSRLPGMASGGPVRETGFYRVGEAGEEIIQLPKGAYVHNASDTQRMLGGSGPAPFNVGLPAMPALPPMSVIEQALAVVVMKLYQKGQIQL